MRLHVYIYFIKNLGGAWKHPSLYSLDFNRWKTAHLAQRKEGEVVPFRYPGAYHSLVVPQEAE